MQGAACAGVSRVGFYGERKSVLFLLIFYNIGGGVNVAMQLMEVSP